MAPAPRMDRLGDPAPHARLLSNGRYTALVTGAGTGFSAFGDVRLTAWDGDRTEDGSGLFVYLRDPVRGRVWSLGHQPVATRAERYAAAWRPGVVTLEREDGGIEARMEVCVDPEADLEIRRIRLSNRSSQARRIEVTSYAGAVLHHAAAEAAHPVFSRLFVQTEYAPGLEALLAHRRPRSAVERWPWLVHALRGDGAPEWETDRGRFLGRGRSLAAPHALESGAPLSGTTGSVLDPALCLRRIVALDPGAGTDLVLLLGAAPNRDTALALTLRHPDPAELDAVFARAEARERREIERHGLAEPEAESLQELLGAMLYGHPVLRAPAEVLRRARGSPADLERHGLSAGRLLAVADDDRADELLRAQAYWRTQGVAVDVRRRSEIPPEDLDVVLAFAHLVVDGALPDLAADGGDGDSLAFPEGRSRTSPPGSPPEPREELRFWNGTGGFTRDGSEYVILRPPPMPWVNVVANPGFGFLVSESGAGFTWNANSRTNRLTPWSNDPVTDPHGEALYLRDEETGGSWSPLPGPVGSGAACEVRHGFGYTTWRQECQGLVQETCMFVPERDPVKLTRVRITNVADRSRRLSLFSCQRLVLGELPAESSRLVVTDVDPVSGALLARGPLRGELGDGVAFAAVVAPADAPPPRFTTDRTAFLGRNGAPDRPAALAGAALDGRTGAGLDPCFAHQVSLEIPAGATVECALLLGEASGADAARALVLGYRAPGAIDGALSGVRECWRRTLSAVRVETPSPALDLLVNGWLGYQTLSCRIWGRSAFYQSGGAFGFRDQLQDAAALVQARPDLTRAQIVLHAGHQFVEGDVLHWWHPPADRGPRTRFSDDLLWLPYLTASYVRATGDHGVLDERAPFLTARALAPGEDEAYLLPHPSGESADIYTHCCRALDRSLARGTHGLPLMGTGDWNDGMNRVGREGRGESVWLGFFLHQTLGEFAGLCERRGDGERVRRYLEHREKLGAALEEAGWDGDWYRRAYYDDGTPLGSSAGDECRIDVLPQAWAVLSGAARPDRAARAMDAVEELLVCREAGLVRLLAPPFDRTPHDPGYIKGYVPGIRENGGQYTHAALWAVRAFAELRRRDRAAALLEMLSPVWHARTPEQVVVYQVEPYVVAADVYGVPPHVGRGGWTWYTGAAGWMLRVALESVLGVSAEAGETLRIRPCIPDEWRGFRVEIRLPDGHTRYEIEVSNPAGRAEAVTAVALDGAPATVEDGAARVPLRRDGALHRVVVTLG